MAEITIGPETELSGCWSYEVDLFDDGRHYRFTVTLNWRDYDHWSRGQTSPETVVRAVLRFLLAHESAQSWPAGFDCASIRRRFPQIDDRVSEML